MGWGVPGRPSQTEKEIGQLAEDLYDLARDAVRSQGLGGSALDELLLKRLSGYPEDIARGAFRKVKSML